MFVPLSGLEDENVLNIAEKMKWYKHEPSLLQVFEVLEPPRRLEDKPLRMTVQEGYQIGVQGSVVRGKIEQGTLQMGDKLKILPSQARGDVIQVEMHHQIIKVGVPGDKVGVSVRDVEAEDIERGSIVTNPKDQPVKQVTSFTAQIVVVNHPSVIKVGYTPLVHCHSARVACRFEKLISIVDKAKGEEVVKKPPHIATGDAAIVELVPERPAVYEPFNECPPLGRFVIRDNNRTVALGIILTVITTDVKPGSKQKKIMGEDLSPTKTSYFRSLSRSPTKVTSRSPRKGTLKQTTQQLPGKLKRKQHSKSPNNRTQSKNKT